MEETKRICPICGKDYSAPELFDAFARHLSMEVNIKTYADMLAGKEKR